MSSFDECPVCHETLTIDTEVIDVYEGMGPECMRLEMCPNKCYVYEFNYGYTHVSITLRGHHVDFGWTYRDDWKVVQDISKAIDVVCKAAQRCQLEDFWNLVHGRSTTDIGSYR
jgi:hypothetical protein